MSFDFSCFHCITTSRFLTKTIYGIMVANKKDFSRLTRWSDISHAYITASSLMLRNRNVNTITVVKYTSTKLQVVKMLEKVLS